MVEAKKSLTPKVKEKPQRVGMLLEKLDDQLFKEVVGIYDRIFKGEGRREFRFGGGVKPTLEMLARSNVAEFRYGSLFSPDSKLEVVQKFSSDPQAFTKKVVTFEFYENTTILPNRQEELGRSKSLFEKSITDLLTEKGLALPLLD